ncbi:hypothetical protein A3J15_03605 [Candidatus Roizmanbacteria bacterium RIFCSPLOWO2_02_FULL_38_10]|uniref:Uncharacterized protein n=1 Tax=Candidatus Roizmanbacteria bacterium RIFCSPLOWO2_02_FULL_38_10 TaxID=1802074 RepID=A0A1F7JJV5_9BACT|nr:MAG: hypothetical protein A3J15_03605 [Candidatus Roizmanbacteria bacterium RIFCSPLOWO2_02_FULL_38_10]
MAEEQRPKKTHAHVASKHGYVVFILALIIGLLINISANIIYEMFLRDNPVAQYAILFLTMIAFVGLIYTYHSKFHQPLARFLKEFE